jgi:glycosyltransferase involved in cell wall biosynthesis
MRVLVVHNSYRSDSPSGEEKVVADDLAMLGTAGVDVTIYRRRSDEIASMSAAKKLASVGNPIYSAQTVREVRALIEQRKPDVMHLHNPYPLISPWVVRVASELGVPVVQTVHNYRHVCVSGSFFRDHQVCTDCSGKRVPWPAVRHGCYRGSRPQSVVMATSLAVHAATWPRVDRFLPVTGFMAAQLERAGIPAARITVKPNCAPDPGATRPPGRSLLYVGRLSEEKGVRALLEAWRSAPHPAFGRLVIAGDGPLRQEAESAAVQLDDIDFVGAVSPSAVGELMDGAAAVVVPSLWFEGFPLTIVEAFSHGRAVIASDLGSLSSIVDDSLGWKFAPGQLGSLLAALGPHEFAERGRAARDRYLAEFSPAAVTSALLQVYDEVATTIGTKRRTA